MTAEIISVGTELLLGNVANTDARDISEKLSELGIDVYYHTVVGDNPRRLTKAVEIAKSRSDIIITTGGLGPTCDDLTKQVLAQAFGRELYFDEEEARRIRSWFEKHRSIKMTDNNLQQAYLPAGCTVFRNEVGTAPGCAFQAEGVHVIMLPGPPNECNAMLNNFVVPYLRKLSRDVILSHTIRVFGEGESSVESKLRDLMNSLSNPTLAPYAKEGEVMLRVTAKADTAEEAEAMMRPVVKQVQEILGDIIYGIDVDSLEQLVVELLSKQGLSLSAAESCTGGLLAKRLTDIPGASKVFKGGATVYTNECKSALLGIDSRLIEENGAVSAEVAVEMACRIRKKLGTIFGLGITGLAGPEGDGFHDVGTVYVALAAEKGCFLRKLQLGNGGRDRIRTLSASSALDMVRRYLTGLPV
ncbi:MAG TPA: competence/damage-inducible protein A [Clostridiales bacterium]|nr:competence/damage-inducible protein A [Clostridiales bacterium]